MTDLKKLRIEINNQATRNDIVKILSFLGYQVTRDFMFKLRPEERTASTSISKDGYIKDFGNAFGWGGDIVSLIHEYHGITLPQATKYVGELLEIDISLYELKKQPKKRGRK